MSEEIRSEIVEAGNLRFEVMQCGDPASRRLALCLHGFPELAYSWRHQMPLLAGLGYKVWAPNQRGYGRSSRPRGARSYATHLLVEDVGHLIDRAGCDSVTLVAHDWGGVVAWLAAMTNVRPIDRLVVMNIPHPAIFARHLRRRAQRRRSWYALFFQVPWLPELMLRARGARAIGEAFRGMAVDKSRFPDEVLDVYRRHALEPGALTAMLNWYRGIRYSRYGSGDYESMPNVRIPTLMIWGELDSALGVETTYGTQEKVDDLTIRYLPGVSHWVQQEAPEAVNEILEAWLLGRPVPGHPTSSQHRLGTGS